MAEASTAEPTIEPHYLESETIKIVVGKDKRTLFVHRGLITKSKFFTACLNPAYREGGTTTIILEEDKPDAVQGFIEWLYLGKLHQPTAADAFKLADCYKFGDKICSEAYCNDIMDMRRRYDYECGQTYGINAVLAVYRKSLRNTPYGKYVLKSMVRYMQTSPAKFAERFKSRAKISSNSTTASVLEDMILEITEYQRTGYGSPCCLKGCQFHTHTDGSACSKADEWVDSDDLDT